MKYRGWAALHRYIGLALFLHWSLLALSGALLVFHREIEFSLHAPLPDLNRPISLDDVAMAVRAERPNAQLVQIATLDGGMELLRVRIKPGDGGAVRSLVFDAQRGRIVGDSSLTGSSQADVVLQFVYRLHQTLLLGDAGKTLVALSGLFLIVNALAGYKLLWPQRRNWRRILRPRLVGKMHIRAILLHRAIGATFAPLLILLALTGAGMNWAPALQQAFIKLGLSAPLVEPPSRPGPERVSPQQALDIARMRFPDADFSSIMFPSTGHPNFVVRLRQSGEVHAIFGATAVTVDFINGQIDVVSDPRTARPGDKVLEWLLALHNGEILGLAGRIPVLLTGLALFPICLLGVFAWTRRARVKNSDSLKTQRSGV